MPYCSGVRALNSSANQVYLHKSCHKYQITYQLNNLEATRTKSSEGTIPY